MGSARTPPIPGAVAAIFETKGRPRFNPLIVHVASLAAAEELAEMGPTARRLARGVLAGPADARSEAQGVRRPSRTSSTAGLDTVAVRVPDHPIARGCWKKPGRPLAAPSANRSGRVSPTLARHVEADFGGRRVAMILDGGPTAHGIESTVLDARSEPRAAAPRRRPRAT